MEKSFIKQVAGVLTLSLLLLGAGMVREVRAGEEHKAKEDKITAAKPAKDEHEGDAEKGKKGKGCWMDCSGSSGPNGAPENRSCIRRCR